MDVCVVTYRNSADRIATALRHSDRLLIQDNTHDNIGFGAGQNRAARRGSDKIICFVNPDGDPAPGCFDALEVALADPRVVAAEASQGVEWDRGPNPDWLSGACLAVRRDAFEATGGFNEALFMYCEDVDLSYRLEHHGRLVHATDAIFHHDASEFRTSLRMLTLNYRNWLTVQHWHKSAEPIQMLRDAVFALRQGRRRDAAARVLGTAEYALRTRNWPPSQIGVPTDG